MCQPTWECLICLKFSFSYAGRFYFNFNPSYVGYGLISPHIVNCSVFLGSVISWGFLWPFIAKQAGDWYPDNLSNTDFRGLYGYKVHIFILVSIKLMMVLAGSNFEQLFLKFKNLSLDLFEEILLATNIPTVSTQYHWSNMVSGNLFFFNIFNNFVK